MSKVSEIMTPVNNLFILGPDEPVRKALDAIRDMHIHGVLIYPPEGKANWRIFTTDDLIGFMASDLPDSIPVEAVSNEVKWSASGDWDVKDCWKAMAKHKVKHLPVIDRKGQLLGIITSSDLEEHL